MCDFFLCQQPTLQFSNTNKLFNNSIQFWDDLESSQTPQIKSSVSHDLRCQSQVSEATHSFDPPAVNLEIPTTLSSVLVIC